MRDQSHFSLSPEAYEIARSGHLEARRQQLVERTLQGARTEVRRALEVGFGSGKLLSILAQRYPQIEFVGTEVEAKMVAYASEHYRAPNLRFLHADALAEECPASFDLVYSIDVLHHIHEPMPFFRSIRTLLRQNGIWVAIEPNIYHPYIFYQQERMRRSGLDEDHFRPWVIEPLLQQVGFAVRLRRFAFFFPGWLSSIPAPLLRLEAALERFRFLGGSTHYLIQAR